MGCFGSFRPDDKICGFCKVVNSCRHKSYELHQREQHSVLLKKKFGNGSFGRTRIKVLDFLNGLQKPLSTTRVWKEVRKIDDVSFDRLKKILLELEHRRLARVKRFGNGLFWIGTQGRGVLDSS